MPFKYPVKLIDLVGHSYNIEGNREALIYGLGVLCNAQKGDLCFAENINIVNFLTDSNCEAIITTKTTFINTKNKASKCFIITDNPSKLFSKIIDKVKSELPSFSFIAKNYNLNNSRVSLDSNIDVDSTLGSNCIIYPQTFIDHDVVIGDFVVIYPGVKIFSNTKIGNNVVIKSNAIIGNKPNCVYKDNDLYFDFDGAGGVIIENNVTIGANTTIDKGLVGKTKISSNTKIGNSVQIGDGAFIDENVLIISQTGISGGAFVGKNTRINGQCGVNNNVQIPPNTTIKAKTIITSNIKEEGGVYFGIPGEESKFYSKKQSSLNKLPRLISSNESFKIHGNLSHKLATVISEQLSIDQDELKMNFNFVQDGGADSLDIVELVMAIEDEFDITISDEEAGTLETVGGVYKFLRRKGVSKNSSG